MIRLGLKSEGRVFSEALPNRPGCFEEGRSRDLHLYIGRGSDLLSLWKELVSP